LKVEAVIENAPRSRPAGDSRLLRAVARAHHRGREDWCKLFKETFRFTGGEIVGEFLISGLSPRRAPAGCPVYRRG
jgi:DNA-3-methyladenine glycosylase I